MINRTKQNWTVGNTVKVGFMSLIVKAAIATPGDWLPDAYLLTNLDGTKLYKFVPHNGLVSLTVDDARELLEEGRKASIAMADAPMAKAAAQSAIKTMLDCTMAQA